ncbi:MAG: hypothetical protein VXX30_06035, partial [Planctomycetota bacterium]|nr:hypothetical protein [Planctomycetota bacterium]
MTFSSKSFSSGVMKRSAFFSVCLRMNCSGALSLLVRLSSMYYPKTLLKPTLREGIEVSSMIRDWYSAS